MNSSTKIIVSGVVATALMSVMLYFAPLMGLPKVDIPEILAAMTNTNIVIGWLLHFGMGILFVFIYDVLFQNWLKRVDNNILRGMIYGFLVFVVAQVTMPFLMKLMLAPNEMPRPENVSMAQMMIVYMLAHLVFGGTLGAFYHRVIAYDRNTVHGMKHHTEDYPSV